MKVIFGSDEKTPLTDFISGWLKENGHDAVLAGHLIDEKMKWRWGEIGKSVGEKDSSGGFDFGIVSCSSGTGVSMAANRFKNARAALCWNTDVAKMARKWDDANILCLSLLHTDQKTAQEILETWFKTPFNEEGLNEAGKLAL